MRYIAVIALLAAVCIALSCGQARRAGNGPGASRNAPGGNSSNSAEGAPGVAGARHAVPLQPGIATAPSGARRMNWWLAIGSALGIAAVLYLLAWLGEGEG